MQKTLNKSQSCNTSSSFFNKNKIHLTNKSLFTNEQTHKNTLSQSSLFYSKTKCSSYYHDSLGSFVFPEKTKPSIKHYFITKESNSSLLKESLRMGVTNLTMGKPALAYKKRHKLAFGKLLPNDTSSQYNHTKVFSSITTNKSEVNNTINTNSSKIFKCKRRPESSSEMCSLFKSGLTQNEYDQIKNYSKNDIECHKQSFPMISSKKLVKNLIPKEYNYSKVKSPEEVLRNAYHPVVRFQKKQLNKHIHNINKEVNVDYSHTFTLVQREKFSEKFRTAENLIDLEKDTKLFELIGNYISSKFKLGNEIDNVIEQKRKRERIEKRKNLLIKFKKVLIRAAIHFKRLGIPLEEFLNMELHHIKPFEHKESFNLIFAIKEKQIETICKMVKENKFLIFDFDNFHQTPLHWAAKRNLYEVISLFACKGAIVSAQDSIGRTPLHVAAKYNHIESVQILLYETANPLIKDNHGMLAFDLAKDQVIKFILQRAATLHKIRNGVNYFSYVNSIKNGLEYLFMEELKTNFEQIKKYLYKE